jgi:hypothetical protein
MPGIRLDLGVGRRRDESALRFLEVAAVGERQRRLDAVAQFDGEFRRRLSERVKVADRAFRLARLDLRHRDGGPCSHGGQEKGRPGFRAMQHCGSPVSGLRRHAGEWIDGV